MSKLSPQVWNIVQYPKFANYDQSPILQARVLAIFDPQDHRLGEEHKERILRVRHNHGHQDIPESRVSEIVDSWEGR